MDTEDISSSQDSAIGCSMNEEIKEEVDCTNYNKKDDKLW